jgi:hypothetical protein
LKKILAKSLALTYFLLSGGLHVEIHYCMGQITDAGFTGMAGSGNLKCGQGGMDKIKSGKHCCKDEYKQVKISVDQKPAFIGYNVEVPLAAILSLGRPQEYNVVKSPQTLPLPSQMPRLF